MTVTIWAHAGLGCFGAVVRPCFPPPPFRWVKARRLERARSLALTVFGNYLDPQGRNIIEYPNPRTSGLLRQVVPQTGFTGKWDVGTALYYGSRSPGNVQTL
jgi:hypothetical protein